MAGLWVEIWYSAGLKKKLNRGAVCLFRPSVAERFAATPTHFSESDV